MSDLKQKLIKVGERHPDLRPHLTRILDRLESHGTRSDEVVSSLLDAGDLRNPRLWEDGRNPLIEREVFDMAVESLYPSIYRDGSYVVQITKEMEQKWAEFAGLVKESVSSYVTDLEHVDNIHWETVGFRRPPIEEKEEFAGMSEQEVPDWNSLWDSGDASMKTVQKKEFETHYELWAEKDVLLNLEAFLKKGDLANEIYREMVLGVSIPLDTDDLDELFVDPEKFLSDPEYGDPLREKAKEVKNYMYRSIDEQVEEIREKKVRDGIRADRREAGEMWEDAYDDISDLDNHPALSSSDRKLIEEAFDLGSLMAYDLYAEVEGDKVKVEDFSRVQSRHDRIDDRLGEMRAEYPDDVSEKINILKWTLDDMLSVYGYIHGSDVEEYMN